MISSPQRALRYTTRHNYYPFPAIRDNFGFSVLLEDTLTTVPIETQSSEQSSQPLGKGLSHFWVAEAEFPQEDSFCKISGSQFSLETYSLVRARLCTNYQQNYIPYDIAENVYMACVLAVET